MTTASGSAAAPSQGPQRGDRAPDFRLPNAEGRLGRFYDRFQGGPVLLAMLDGGGDLLDAVLAIRAEMEGLGVRLVVVFRDLETTPAPPEAATLAVTYFADPQGAISGGYGARRASLLLLDANQRVRRRWDDPTDPDEVCRSMLDMIGELTPATPRTVSAQAPVLVLPELFEPALCRRLIDAWAADHGEGEVRLRRPEEAGRSRAVDYSLKKRLDHRPAAGVNRDLSALVMRRLAPEVLKAFQFTTAVVENFCIAAYTAGRGDYFRPHRDNTTPQTALRRFAVTVNLNEDYEGGGLAFPEYGEALYSAPAGGAVVFSCSLLHEARPITAGTRYVALTFLYDREAVAAARSRQGPSRDT